MRSPAPNAAVARTSHAPRTEHGVWYCIVMDWCLLHEWTSTPSIPRRLQHAEHITTGLFIPFKYYLTESRLHRHWHRKRCKLQNPQSHKPCTIHARMQKPMQGKLQ